MGTEDQDALTLVCPQYGEALASAKARSSSTAVGAIRIVTDPFRD